MFDTLKSCCLCPRNCKINRLNGQTGYCKSGKKVKVARVSLHEWEEPCISGTKGSGTVFFSSCNLRCIFCQNHQISQEGFGKEISIERLAEIFIEQQERGAHNINLVTPTHFVPQIIEALDIAKKNRLNIPILYNSNGYENLDTIKSLEGYIDVYLPDLKYYDDKFAIKYSNAPEYFQTATKVIDEMTKQVGQIKFNAQGIIEKGVIIRHLMLPGLLFDTKKIIDYINTHYKNTVYISIMNQYTPMWKACNYPEINKTLNPKHYDSIINYCLSLGLENGFIQESGTSSEVYVPEFDLRGV